MSKGPYDKGDELLDIYDHLIQPRVMGRKWITVYVHTFKDGRNQGEKMPLTKSVMCVYTVQMCIPKSPGGCLSGCMKMDEVELVMLEGVAYRVTAWQLADGTIRERTVALPANSKYAESVLKGFVRQDEIMQKHKEELTKKGEELYSLRRAMKQCVSVLSAAIKETNDTNV